MVVEIGTEVGLDETDWGIFEAFFGRVQSTPLIGGIATSDFARQTYRGLTFKLGG